MLKEETKIDFEVSLTMIDSKDSFTFLYDWDLEFAYFGLLLNANDKRRDDLCGAAQVSEC